MRQLKDMSNNNSSYRRAGVVDLKLPAIHLVLLWLNGVTATNQYFNSLKLLKYQSCVSSFESCPIVLQKLLFGLDALPGTYDSGSGLIRYLKYKTKGIYL